MVSSEYFFVHRLIPRYVRECEEELLEKFRLNKIEKGAFLNYMNTLWFEVCDGIGEQEKRQASNFEIVIENINDNISLLAIKMPEPKGMPEAKYIAFLFFLDTPERIRYFTYELNLNSETKENSFFVCEWSKNGDHLNYGDFSKPDLKCFTNAIKNILRHNLFFKSAYIRN